MTESVNITKELDSLTTLGFRTVSDGVSYYEASTPAEVDPSLILLCSWAFAQSRHIAKYVTRYQTIYPGSPILLVQNVVANAIWRPDSWQHDFFAPAAHIIHEHAIHDSRVLVHIFSNGGSHAAVQVSEVYQRLYASQMPVHALIMDSCPGQPRFKPTVEALKAPMKHPVAKFVAGALSWVMVTVTAVCDILELSEPAAFKLYRKLNDVDDAFLVRQKQIVPRVYLFSKTDTMILEDDVRGHAEVARTYLVNEGFSSEDLDNNVRVEEFVGTAHVNHVKAEPVRYWEIVQSTWGLSQAVR